MKNILADHSPIFRIIPPMGSISPIVLSSPHSGTLFPREILPQIKQRYYECPEDTDWHIDCLYDFAPDMGMTLIAANCSRYVIDLNRDPRGQALYQDQRVETGLVPIRSFANEPLYTEGQEPNSNEISRRIAAYYDPYYAGIQRLIDERQAEFGSVLFFDCHSIRRNVPSIRKAPFPDLIIGTQDGRTADPKLCAIAQASLARHSRYQVSYNDPFKGGYLTRWFGKPEKNVHAIQLEMSQDLYLEEGSTKIDQSKWELLRSVLKILMQDLLAGLEGLNEAS